MFLVPHSVYRESNCDVADTRLGATSVACQRPFRKGTFGWRFVESPESLALPKHFLGSIRAVQRKVERIETVYGAI